MLFNFLGNLAVKSYFHLASKKRFQNINDKILNLALRSGGYNNYLDYESSGEKYFLENILPSVKPKVCIDVGANIGTYACLLLQNTLANVYSFEPLTKPFESLSLLKTIHPDRFFPINNGVGDKNETLSIHYNDESSTLASFVEDVKNVSYVKNEKIQKIDVVSLDSFFRDGIVNEIDFIKIDTEGFEYQVLLGSQEIINKYKPKFIQIEYNWHQLFSGQSLFTLSKLLGGYQPYQLLKDRLEIRDPKDPLTNIYLFSNYIFVRDDLVGKII